jgi:hypothetical protein
MSRQPFASILRNAEELLGEDDGDDEGVHEAAENAEEDDIFCDLRGYSLYDWVNYAEVGWDEPMQTYFLQAIELDEGPVWWFGQMPGEVPTFEALCRASVWHSAGR